MYLYYVHMYYCLLQQLARTQAAFSLYFLFFLADARRATIGDIVRGCYFHLFFIIRLQRYVVTFGLL